MIPYTPTAAASANGSPAPARPGFIPYTPGQTTPVPSLPSMTQAPAQPTKGNMPFANQPATTFVQKIASIPSQIAGAGKAVFNLFTNSEQNLGGEIAAGAPASVTGEAQLNAANEASNTSDIQFIKAMNQRKAAGQPLTAQQQAIYTSILAAHAAGTTGTGITQTDLLPHAADTNTEALGNIAGTAADILSAGSYGAEARAAESFSRFVPKTTEAVVKPTLIQIAKQTAARSAVGGGIGYTYDVSNNLQQGKTGAAALEPGAATVAGATLPALIGGVRAGVAISKEQAPRFINSLIKPKTADFAYGKDPGRTVTELGITGNSLPDFSKNITTAKNDIVGAQLGAIYDLPENQSLRINANPAISKIDEAIHEAAKGGKQNQSIVTQLSNIKDALLYEHGVNEDGQIVRIGDTPRDLSSLSPKEAQALIGHVSDQTKFTGNPSDDKVVNSTLKQVYGDIRERINAAVSVNSPEVIKLNQQYADLTSAELAVQNREKIVQRSNLVSMPIKTGGTVGLIAAIATGGAAIPAAIAAGSAYGLDKALESTAVKTRIASWLGSQSTSQLSKFFADNPKIAPVLTRAFPAILGKITGAPASQR